MPNPQDPVHLIQNNRKKVKFFIIYDETDLVKIGEFDFNHVIVFQKSDLKTLIDGLQNFHDSIQKLNSVPTNSRTIEK